MELAIQNPDDLRNNKMQSSDRAFHDWYRFVLSFPPHLVRHYISRFSLDHTSCIFDPFCGTGTTLVEAKKNHIPSFGTEAFPMGYFASKVKTCWNIDARSFENSLNKVVGKAQEAQSGKTELLNLSPEQDKLILTNSISEIPLHKCLLLRREIEKVKNSEIKASLMLALASVAVFSASNLKFGPEVGVRRKLKEDADVFGDFQTKGRSFIDDLKQVAEQQYPVADVFLQDSRQLNGEIPLRCIDAVITSPPYPNEKDYTRTTRLESVLLGFIANTQELRTYKHTLLRSNTRNVYVKDDDDALISEGSKIDKIAKEIERRRIAMNKTSGFERLYPRVTRLYFGGMKRHLMGLKPYLKQGAKLAYVVGDQASYLQVLIRTGELLGEIAEELGYKVLDLELFRTRPSTATGELLREEVLILEWNDKRSLDSMKKKNADMNRYDHLIEKVFFQNFKKGARVVEFDREEFAPIAKELKITLPKNLGDIIYSYRYRNKLPKSISGLLESGEEWVIRSVGRGKYQFAKSTIHRISPNPRLASIKILDSTPEIIRRYALNDEQALLAILRYNRLVDIFLGVTCYPLQSHLRTTVAGMGQVETDEIYVGVNTKGMQFVIPVQAKGKTDEIGIVQIEQDFAICKEKFPGLICRSIAAQFIKENLIALFEFEMDRDEVKIREEKHYQLVPNTEMDSSEINARFVEG